MLDFLQHLFDTSDWPSRWYCGSWTPEHGWLHIVSDLGVWSAYIAIPCVLGFFALRRKDMPFRTVFWLFGAFILACGTTHLMEAVIFWWPAYRLAGVIKLFTALVSWATVIALVPLVPQALAMRSPEELKREIAERKKAEQELVSLQRQLEALVQQRTTELRERVEEMEALMHVLPIAVFRTDNPDCRHITGNRAGAELFGVSPDSNVSLAAAAAGERAGGYKLFREGKEVPIPELPMQKAAALGVEVRDAEMELIRADGTRRLIAGYASPLFEAGGAVRGCVSVFLDVTERRQLEEALRQRAADLAETDRRKDEFLAMLSHELRNPLAPVLNGLHILRIPGVSPETAERTRDMMGRQLHHLIRLVDDLLDVSRIVRGRIELRKEAYDFRQVVDRAVETARPLIDAQGHELTLDIPTDPIWMTGDPIRLTQVVANLLNNAAKYTERGGQIRLFARQEGDELIVRVRDTGVGISPDLLTKIFDLFMQAESTLARSQGGLGIGLTLVRRLVELHGGRIEALSEGPGKGSEFVIHLPNSSQPSAETKPQANAVAIPFLRVLVVDDNVDAAESLAVLLRDLGQEVRVAHDGRAALSAAAGYRPDVVLLDIGLPELSGYDVARQLRQDPAFQDTLLVAVTGYGQDEDRHRSTDAGFDHHLVKPVDPGTLRQVLGPVASV